MIIPRANKTEALMLNQLIIPVFSHEDAGVVIEVITALYKGGMKVFEFTNRPFQAIHVFAEVARHFRKRRKEYPELYPDLVLGVGTVKDAHAAAACIQAGAQFVVGPNFDPDAAKICHLHQVSYVPGTLTVNEIKEALEAGCRVVKIFPGGVPGPGFIKTVHAVLPGLPIVPTGGVDPDKPDEDPSSLFAWFKGEAAAVGMGSKLIKKEWVKGGKLDAEAITRRAKEVLEKAQSIVKALQDSQA